MALPDPIWGRLTRRPFFMRLSILTLAALPAAPAHAASQSYVITSFDSIRVDAPVRVHITTGAGVSAKGDGDRDLLDRIDIRVSGKQLVIRLRRGHERTGTAQLRLSTGVLNRVTVNGGGLVDAGQLTGKDISIANNGPGSVRITASASAQVHSTGSGDTTVIGKPACTVSQAGSGTVTCGNQNY